MIVLGYNLDKNKNLASGIVISGAGVGVFVIPMLWQWLLDAYGLSGTFLLIGGLSLQLSLSGVLYRPSNLERTYKVPIQCHRKGKSTSSRTCAQNPIFHSLPLCFLCGSVLFVNAGMSAVYVHLPTYATTKGFSDGQSYFLISLVGVGSLMGRLLVGVAGNSIDIDELNLSGGCLAIAGMATLVLPAFADSYNAFMVYSVIWGFYHGGMSPLLLAMSVEMVGVKALASAFAAEMVFCGIGFIVGPIIAGLYV